MKILKYIFCLTFFAFMGIGCNDFLDVNTNPNVPQEAPAHALLPAMFQNVARGIQFDARYIGKYTQSFVDNLANNAWDQHGYLAGSDAGGEIWRQHYFAIGRNVDLLINDARGRNMPAYIGIGYAMRAWGWQAVADCNGDGILKQAWELNRNTFEFDSQEDIYKESNRLLDSSLFYLNQKGIDDSNLPAADQFYGGNLDRWKRFVNGLKARNLHRLTNKASYDANAVIAACDASLTANADNATVPFLGNTTDDANFFGTLRSNMTGFRLSAFMVSLLDGSNPTMLGAIDPRLRFMLPQSTAADTVVRGGAPGAGASTLNVWGYTNNPSPSGVRGRYLFVDAARFPIMTYSEIQFIKSEAAFRKGDKATALTAYRNAIGAHFDFANTYVGISGSITTTSMTPAQRTALLADTRLVPAVADSLSMSRIMLQKYVALWGWGFIETWNDMRRFHYTDAINGQQVYANFKLPTTLFTGSGNKPAYRLRPRFNSEYVWNRAALDKIGGNNVDYQTYEMWNTKP
jgi:Starch-binding associating with outer membrane